MILVVRENSGYPYFYYTYIFNDIKKNCQHHYSIYKNNQFRCRNWRTELSCWVIFLFYFILFRGNKIKNCSNILNINIIYDVSI